MSGAWREVQDLLGHKTAHMTPKYARLANERLVEIVGRRGSHVDPAADPSGNGRKHE